jgi:GNAT superfamily N-acetyltransferase
MFAVDDIDVSVPGVPGCFGGAAFDSDICRLDAGHLPAIGRFLSDLDHETWLLRFGEPLADTAFDVQAIDILRNAALVLGIFSDRGLRGMAGLYPCTTPGTLELRLVVERKARRQGRGWRLMSASLRHASHIGARRYEFAYSGDDWPMRRIAHKVSATIDLVFGTYRAFINLQDPQFAATLRQLQASHEGFAGTQGQTKV